MHYGVVGADNRLKHYIPIPLPGPRLPHDMAFTTRLLDLRRPAAVLGPVELRPRATPLGSFATCRPVSPSFRASASTGGHRAGSSRPDYVLHCLNAFEDGDGLVLDGTSRSIPRRRRRRMRPATRAFSGSWPRSRRSPRLHRWRMNLRTGATEEYDLTDVISEFGMINGQYNGRRHRYGYAATRIDGIFLFDGFVKHDLQTGNRRDGEAARRCLRQRVRLRAAGRFDPRRTMVTSSPSPRT